MKDNKLTPEEIKKALECCVGSSPNCDDCPANRYEAGKCFDIVKIQAVAIMNSQQAEIERLQNEIGSFEKKYPCKVRLGEHCLMYARSLDDYDKQIGDISTEAIKEFAKRLKKNTIDVDVSYGYGREHYTEAVAVIEIDNLVKEMVGEQE